MSLRSMSGTGVGDKRDQISQVAGIADRGAYALIGKHAADNEIFYSQVPQNVMDVGGNEYTGRRLEKNDFIVNGLDTFMNLGIPGTFGNIETTYFVVKAAIPSILGQVFDHRVEYFNPGISAGLLQTPHIWQDNVAEAMEIIVIFAQGFFWG